MTRNCGLVDPENSCRCTRVVPYAIRTRWIDPENLVFEGHPVHARTGVDVPDARKELDRLQRIAVLFRSHPDYAAPETFVETMKELLESGRFELLQGPH